LIEAIFGRPKAIIGVVHLLPLPGSSRWDGDLQAVIDRAVKDAKSLEMGGIHGVIVENYGDVPFRKSNVLPSTISAMTLTVKAVKESVNLPIGVNVLRNDALSALSIATVTNANFIRVNVHLGTMVTDEGIIEGQAEETLRYRGLLGSNVKIFADVMVKHAVTLGEQNIDDMAISIKERGLADALIVSGKRTGGPTSREHAEIVKKAVPGTPLLVGSGINYLNISELLSVADGAIVGTSLKKGNVVTNPVDTDKVRSLITRFESISKR
jgi:membrane complex biogenesis BtpA family protein